MKTNSISPLCNGAHHGVIAALAIAFSLALVLLAGVRPARAQSPKQDYDEHCADCHGLTGKGNGEAAGLLVSTKMPDITQLAKKNGGRFPFEQVVEIIDGRRNIPSHERIQMTFWGVTMQNRAQSSRRRAMRQ